MDGPDSYPFPLLLEGQTKRRPAGASVSIAFLWKRGERGKGATSPARGMRKEELHVSIQTRRQQKNSPDLARDLER